MRGLSRRARETVTLETWHFLAMVSSVGLMGLPYYSPSAIQVNKLTKPKKLNVICKTLTYNYLSIFTLFISYYVSQLLDKQTNPMLYSSCLANIYERGK